MPTEDVWQLGRPCWTLRCAGCRRQLSEGQGPRHWSSPATTVHSQTGPSGANGDAVSNDYQMLIPFVRPDQYSVTLDYIVTTN